jgi:cell wall-associated NlpC family hydrolase
VLKKITVITLIAILTVGASVCVSYADKYSSGDLSDAKQKTQSAKSDLDAAQQEQAAVQADLTALQNKIDASVARLSKLNDKISKTQMKMEELSEKLFNLEEQLSTQQSDLNTWLRQMYLTGDTNMVDVLLTSENFEDLINSMDMVKRIYDFDMKIIQEIADKQEQIEKKKQELKETDASLKKQKKSVEQEKKDLTADQQVLEAELTKAGLSTQAAKEAYDNAMADQSSISSAIARQRAAALRASYDSGSSGSSPSYSSNPGEPLSDEDFQKVLAEATKHLGKKYVFGASGPNTFDCSGFVAYVFDHALGIGLTHSAAGMASGVTKVSPSDRAPGDLIFFQGTYKSGVSHVGIYVGGGRMIHASSSGRGVVYSDVDESYYQATFYCYGRI